MSMKKCLNLILPLLILFAGCTESDPQGTTNSSSTVSSCSAGNLADEWTGQDTGDYLVINNDCTGTSSICGGGFSFYYGGNKDIVLTVSGFADDERCFPNGTQECFLFEDNENQFTLSCPDGFAVYARIDN